MNIEGITAMLFNLPADPVLASIDYDPALVADEGEHALATIHHIQAVFDHPLSAQLPGSDVATILVH